MKIIVMSICYNQADILPWYLRHYGAFADEIAVWDDFSTDGSRDILRAHPKVVLRDWPYPESGISEDLFLEFAYEWYPKATGYDWVMWVDPDEFIYAPDIKAVLDREDKAGIEVIQTMGFNMVGDGLPADDGRQLWEIEQRGVYAPVYSKPVVLKPTAKIKWNRGKHALSECNSKISDGAKLKLLHYRYMGAEYTRIRNSKNYERCGGTGGDKGAAWSCSPEWKGEHSPDWAEAIKKDAVQII